ncbi:GNAT family N-acetyltransferase [Actinocrinis sp.]|uniref:GNAT family N-acetyltransferase n=1 Tax=Actinocrinis sp. TaxID=1920516 RepID=UPI002D4DFA67|nr:GNAT family N-acetyltransferase [Actinocrinis sp.]HZP53646.1 GNAT family N-acetyltransferase [Actinocrinis sp.]
MHLRDVELSDVDAYIRMRCDPVMMAELGGPLPPEGMAEKVRRDVETVASGRGWIKMIIPDEAAPHVVAGNVVLWSHEDEEPDCADPAPAVFCEIGWMVLPEFQGRGLAKLAVRELLRLAHEDGRWGRIHAFPGATNGPSNGICRSLGFTLDGKRDVTFAGRVLHTNHWSIDPADAILVR